MGLLDALGRLFGGEEPAVDAVEDPSDPSVPVGTVREAADDFAAERADLDFSLSSLAALAAFAADRDRSADAVDAEHPADDEELLRVGAYFGETLIRQYGGGWEYHAGWTVRLAPDDDLVEVPAFEVAARSLADEPTFRRVADGVERELESGDDRTVEGRGLESGDGPAPADEGGADSPPIAEAAERHAAAATDLEAAWPDRDLDRSVVSLARLDALVEEATDAIAEEVGPTAVAGYFAAVLRRKHDAAWHRTDDGPRLRLSGPDGTTDLDPDGLARTALAGEASFVDAYASAAATCGVEPSLPK
ncbi:MAG: hypothetical protein V5A23_02380 [Halobacteriales archaeon]